MTGKIIILNGASSSGKTSLLKAVQDIFEEPFLDLGIDRFIFSMPRRYLERPLWDGILGLADQAGETGYRLINVMHHAILAAAKQGENVIADHVIVESSWLADCAQLFAELPAWLVAVRCPLEVLEAREKARKNRTLGQARLQYFKVHQPGIYDLEVDTSLYTPEECALQIKEHILSGKNPTAFHLLKQRLALLADQLTEPSSVQTPLPVGFRIFRDAPLPGIHIENLRQAVGWDRMDGAYDAILRKSYAHFSISQDQNLIGFVNVISDGIGDAFLVDLMIHPDFQRRGLGRVLIQETIRQLSSDGIRAIELLFEPHLENFYQENGFFIIKGGIIDNSH